MRLLNMKGPFKPKFKLIYWVPCDFDICLNDFWWLECNWVEFELLNELWFSSMKFGTWESSIDIDS